MPNINTSLVSYYKSPLQLIVLALDFLFNTAAFSWQCKHQLAARLASSLGTCTEVKVSDEQLAVLFSNLWDSELFLFVWLDCFLTCLTGVSKCLNLCFAQFVRETSLHISRKRSEILGRKVLLSAGQKDGSPNDYSRTKFTTPTTPSKYHNFTRKRSHLSSHMSTCTNIRMKLSMSLYSLRQF